MIEWEVQGADTLAIRVQAQHERLRDALRDAIADALDSAEKSMHALVPRESGALATTIRKSGIVYVPGGVGGGGVFEATLVAGEGIDYLNVVVEGSGIYGTYGSSLGSIQAGAGNIRGPKTRPEWLPRKGSKLMVFTWKGKKRFFPSVKGQPGDDRWIRAARLAADAVMRDRLARLDAIHE